MDAAALLALRALTGTPVLHSTPELLSIKHTLSWTRSGEPLQPHDSTNATALLALQAVLGMPIPARLATASLDWRGTCRQLKLDL